MRFFSQATRIGVFCLKFNVSEDRRPNCIVVVGKSDPLCFFLQDLSEMLDSSIKHVSPAVEHQAKESVHNVVERSVNRRLFNLLITSFK